MLAGRSARRARWGREYPLSWVAVEVWGQILILTGWVKYGRLGSLIVAQVGATRHLTCTKVAQYHSLFLGVAGMRERGNIDVLGGKLFTAHQSYVAEPTYKRPRALVHPPAYRPPLLPQPTRLGLVPLDCSEYWIRRWPTVTL